MPRTIQKRIKTVHHDTRTHMNIHHYAIDVLLFKKKITKVHVSH